MKRVLFQLAVVLGCTISIVAIIRSVGESQTPGPDTPLGVLFSVIPADAMLAMAVDGNQLTELVPMLPAGLVIGSDSALWRGIDETVANRLGIHIGATTTWGFFVGFDDDEVGIIGLGPVSGETSLTPVFNYRGTDVYTYDDEEIFFYYSPEGVVVGTAAAVTGVLDTVFGGTRSLLERPDLENAMSVITSETIYFGIGTIEGLDRILDIELDDFDLLEETRYWGLAANESQVSSFSVFEDSTQASDVDSQLQAILEAAETAITDLGERVGEFDFGEEMAVRILLNVSQEMLEGQVTHRAVGNTAFFEVDSGPVVAFVGTMSLLAAQGFERFQDRSMTSEAVMNLRRLYDSSVGYYDSDHTTAAGEILAPQFPESVPLTPSEVPCGSAWVNPTDWEQDTWEALNFGYWYDEVHYYSYQYDSSGTGIGSTFTASAFGDLDCDGIHSTFMRVGEVIEGNEVRGFGGMYQNNELE